MNKQKVKGFDITIENIVGSIRSGVDEKGNKWSTEMKNAYGYFDDTVGADGDELDVFLGPDLESDFKVYVINQSTGSPRKFDEHKVMFGFLNKEESIKAYFDNYEKGWKGFDDAITFTLDEFKEWFKSGRLSQPAKPKEVLSVNYVSAETYNDYPQSASNNAKKALKWRDEHGRKEVSGGTSIGWTRANQLAKREKISRETIGRMAAFKRHEKNSEIDPKYKSTPWKDKGYVAWLLWGGTSGVNWAIKKKESIDKAKMKNESMSKIKRICLKGEVETDITLKGLQEQAGETNSFETLILEISSQGGCVEEGLKIMVWLDLLSQGGKEIITVVSANAYSIASLIMLAADKRYISKHGEVMVHNPMVPFLEYANANELEKHAIELRNLESMLQQLYVNFANISIEEIKGLMDQETYLSPDEAVLKGFADEVIDIKPKPFSMMAIKNEINMKSTRNILNVVIAAVNGSEVVNQMYYNTKGEELQIFQANPAKYGKGDKTSLESGEVRLSDGTMLKIKNYEIESIEKEVEQPAVAEEAVPEGEVKAEEVAPVAAFNEGPAPEKALAKAVNMEPEAPKAMEPETPKAMEPEVPKAMEPEVPKAMEPEVPAAMEPEAAPVQEVIEAVEEEEKADPMIEHQKAMDDMVKRIEALEKKIAESGEFETLATEAIDTLARNTSSAFKPEARKVEKVEAKKYNGGASIFQRFKSSNK